MAGFGNARKAQAARIPEWACPKRNRYKGAVAGSQPLESEELGEECQGGDDERGGGWCGE